MENECMKILIIKKSKVKNEYLTKLTTILKSNKCDFDIVDYNEVEEFYTMIHKKSFKNYYDILVSFGGDGTILKAARVARKLDIPILGINVGTIGFLTSINNIKQLKVYFEKFLKGDFLFEDRYMLCIEVSRDGKTIFKSYAVNEATLTSYNLRKMGKYDVRIGNIENEFNEYRADGLIVSSPTGSTAHSLSAGGPIVEPSVNCFVLTAICPHAFNERSIIISDKKSVFIKILNDGQLVDVDGRIENSLEVNDVVKVTKIKKAIKYIVFDDNNFLNNVKNKIRNI